MSAPSSIADRGFAGLLALAVAFGLFVFVFYGLAMIFYPLQVDYGEGVVLQLTQTLSDGQPLYREPAAYPWLVDPYAPLYMAVCAALRPVVGLTLLGGRLVSWLAALGTLACLVLTARRHGGNRAAWCTAALFACSPLTVHWAVMYRVDFLGLFLDVAALSAVDAALAAPAGPRRRLAIAGPLFALAFFTKQTFVLGLAAACVTLAVRRDRWTAAGFALYAGLCIGLPFLALQRASGGYLFASLFTNNVMPWSWARAWPWFSQYLLASALPVAAVIVARRGPLLWGLYLGLTSLTLVGVGRIGAYFNHFLPFHAALALMAGIALASLLTTARPASRALVAALLASQIAVFGIFGDLKPTLYSLARVCRVLTPAVPSLIDEARVRQEKDVKVLDRYPGDVVAENMALPVLAGRAPVLCDPSTLFAMAEAGRWDESAFIDAVRAHRFGVVLLQVTDARNPRFSAAALAAIAENYEEAERLQSGDHLLVPRRTQSPHP